MYLLLYVDDILIIGKEKSEIKKIKGKLSEEFDMKDLSKAKKILGIEIDQSQRGMIKLSQTEYLKKTLEKFGMDNSKAVSTPLVPHVKLSQSQNPQTIVEKKLMEQVPYTSIIGSLTYAMVWWPGSCFKCSTLNLGIIYNNQTQAVEEVAGYVDSDYAANIDTRRSLTGLVFTVFGGAVSWKSNLQKVIALSTTEA
uniref:Reverse transcriptase Ty1/copia-type domain-containing protein n=1 Tax=Cannabis sativa TaxID=3483 RepID=A0A803PW15_CANSA